MRSQEASENWKHSESEILSDYTKVCKGTIYIKGGPLLSPEVENNIDRLQGTKSTYWVRYAFSSFIGRYEIYGFFQLAYLKNSFFSDKDFMVRLPYLHKPL